MKKILSILFTLVLFLSLAACAGGSNKTPEETPEEKSERAFSEYMAANDGMTVEEFDEAFAEASNVEMPADLFTTLKLENISVDATATTQDGTQNVNLFAWQTENKIYLAAKEETTIDAFYIDLDALEVLYDENKGNVETELKPSEAIDQAIAQALEEQGVTATINLETILGALTFKAEDFDLVEVGKFALKNEALFGKIATVSGGMITAADLQAQLAESGMSLNLYIYFDNNHVTGYELSLVMAQEGMTMTMSAKISLTYNEDVITGIGIDLAMPGTTVDFDMNSTEDAVSFSLNLSSMADGNIMVISATATISEDNIKVNIKQGTQVLFDCNLNLDYQKVNNVHTFGVNGTLSFNAPYESETGTTYMPVNLVIKSGSNAVIPADVKAEEANAEDLMEIIANSGSGNDDYIEAPEKEYE